MGIKFDAADDLATMRPLPHWLTKSDVVILSYLDGHTIDDFESPPKTIARNGDISESHTRKRVLILKRSGLIELAPDTRGYYRLTDMGRRFLDDDLTTNERAEIEAFDPEEADEAEDGN